MKKLETPQSNYIHYYKIIRGSKICAVKKTYKAFLTAQQESSNDLPYCQGRLHTCDFHEHCSKNV